jgi:hypothetical protein
MVQLTLAHFDPSGAVADTPAPQRSPLLSLRDMLLLKNIWQKPSQTISGGAPTENPENRATFDTAT